MTDEKHSRPKRLTAQRKFQIYIETRAKDAPIGEILRRYGLHLKDLRDIEEKVESSAIAGLKVHYGRQKKRRDFTPEEYEEMAEELRRKDKALADLAAEYQLFKKKEALESQKKKRGKSYPKY